MKIKTLRLFAAMALSGLFFVAGCSKPTGQKPAASTQITITASEVSVQTMSISVSVSGATPSLVRFLSPIEKETFLTEAGSLTDKEKVTAYITRNGQAISLPYQVVAKDLTASMEYVTGAVAFDADMNVCAWRVIEVKTLDPGMVTVGDASGAGTVNENVL